MSQRSEFGMKFIDAKKATWTDDKLDRKKYAAQLTQLVKNMDKPFAMTLSAPWGSGKTFFLNAWKNEIEWKGNVGADEIPCVYFNAWEYDCVDDPLLAIVGKMQEELAPLLDYEADSIQDEIDKASNNPQNTAVQTSNPFSKLTAVTKSIFTKENLCKMSWAVTGRALNKMTANVFEDALKDTVAEGLLKEEDIEKIFNKAGQTIENSPKAKLKAVMDEKKVFSKTVEDVVKACREKLEHNYPILIMIDELDRCRPDYVISLLERIKNLFEVEGIFFVLAIDKEQLYSVVEHTFGVKKIGDRDNRAIYLQKFINMDYELPEPSLVNYANWLLLTMPMLNQKASYPVFKENYKVEYSGVCSDMIYLYKNSGYNSLREFEFFIQKLNIIVLSFKDITYSEILIIWKSLLDKKIIRTLYTNELCELDRTKNYYNNEYNFLDNILMNINLFLLQTEEISKIQSNRLNNIQFECQQILFKFYQDNGHSFSMIETKPDNKNYKWLKQIFANYLTLVNKE